MKAFASVQVQQCNNSSHARTNQIYVSPKVYSLAPSEHIVLIKGSLFLLAPDDSIPDNQVQLNFFQRNFLYVAYKDILDLKPYDTNKNSALATSVTFEVSLEPSRNKSAQKYTFKAPDLVNLWKTTFPNLPLNLNMKYFFKTEEAGLVLELRSLEAGTLESDGSIKQIPNPTSALFSTSGTAIKFIKKEKENIMIEDDDNEAKTNTFFKQDWSFEEMGVGGLDSEFATLFRRAFASRIYPPKIVKQMGMQHVKGILLYGPPGTGKTLMARQIGKMLNCAEPKIVNGPEIFDKMVGESEKHIRQLFEEAEKDEAENGDNAQLHLIIMDEIDSICKKRGSVNNGTGVNDQVVNQLLTKIDGVNALNDVLLIGMTNRRDLMDDALLRPGRLEVQLEIHLPDKKGRYQIFEIHTKTQRENKRLADDVNLEELAELTPNYTGAEIAGVVRSAVSFAMNEFIDMSDLQNSVMKADNIKVTRECFMKALEEIKPEFGIEEDILGKYARHGCISYSQDFQIKRDDIQEHFIKALIEGKRTESQAYLIYGKTGCGLTSFAVTLASNSKFNFIRIISAEKFIGVSEDSTCSEILGVFSSAYKSSSAAIIIDDLDRIIEYSKMGPRYSNKVLQAILTLIKNPPPQGHKLGIFITTTQRDELAYLGVDETYFDKEIELLPIKKADEFRKVAMDQSLQLKEIELPDQITADQFFNDHPLPIKKAIQALDMADFETNDSKISWDLMKSCICRFV